jgi:hypothetical protein
MYSQACKISPPHFAGGPGGVTHEEKVHHPFLWNGNAVVCALFHAPAWQPRLIWVKRNWLAAGKTKQAA